MKQQKALTLKTLTKSNVWEVEENDIFRMWETAEKESDFKDNRNHYRYSQKTKTSLPFHYIINFTKR